VSGNEAVIVDGHDRVADVQALVKVSEGQDRCEAMVALGMAREE
jgi:hypothetical protein